MTNHSSDISAQINIHFVQLEPGRSFRLTEFEKIIRLSPHSTFQCYFNVQDKRTLELCLARWWSSLAIIDTSYSIRISFNTYFTFNVNCIYVVVKLMKDLL